MHDQRSDPATFHAIPDPVEYAHALLTMAARGDFEHFNPSVGRSPASPCCTPDEAREWLEGLLEAGEPPEIIEAALRHVAEVEHAEIP